MDFRLEQEYLDRIGATRDNGYMPLFEAMADAIWHAFEEVKSSRSSSLDNSFFFAGKYEGSPAVLRAGIGPDRRSGSTTGGWFCLDINGEDVQSPELEAKLREGFERAAA